MSDELKEFIASHRDAFDSGEPSEDLWKRIEQSIVRKPAKPVLSIRAFRWNLLAAAALVTVVSVSLFHQAPEGGAGPQATLGGETSQATHSTAGPQAGAPKNSDSLYDRELYYFSQIINTKFQEVAKIKTDHPDLYARFSGDLQKLDSTYRQLKQQLPGQINEEMLLQAMLQNLTLQVELINRQLGIIQQLKNESHAKVTKSI